MRSATPPGSTRRGGQPSRHMESSPKSSGPTGTRTPRRAGTPHCTVSSPQKSVLLRGAGHRCAHCLMPFRRRGCAQVLCDVKSWRGRHAGLRCGGLQLCRQRAHPRTGRNEGACCERIAAHEPQSCYVQLLRRQESSMTGISKFRLSIARGTELAACINSHAARVGGLCGGQLDEAEFQQPFRGAPRGRFKAL